jgi:hypothetical protein
MSRPRRRQPTHPEDPVTSDDAHDEAGLHGIDFGGGFLAVFCERENLLAMYPHVCPLDETGFPTDAELERAAAETTYAPGFRVPATDHHARLAAENTEAS